MRIRSLVTVMHLVLMHYDKLHIFPAHSSWEIVSPWKEELQTNVLTCE